MRLYSKTGAIQIDDPEFGTFTPNEAGAFDGLPDAMYAKLHGRPGWESQDERDLRVAQEELDRFRDPAELLKAVKELGANQGMLTQALAGALGLSAGRGATPPAAASAADTEAPLPEPPTETAPAQASAAQTPADDAPAAPPVSKRTRKSAPPPA